MSILMEMQIFENELGATPKFRIKLPAVPRKGETITLPDAHYVVEEVYWHAHIPITKAPEGFSYPDITYYTIKLVVRQKFSNDQLSPTAIELGDTYDQRLREYRQQSPPSL